MNSIKTIQGDVDTLRDDFKKEYGTDNINIQDGTIGYPQDDPNPEENGETDKED